MSRKYAILGETLKHTMSPPIHARLFELKNREYEYEILEVKPEELKDKAEYLNSLNGYNITIPHKIGIIDYTDELDQSAKRYHSVNCVDNKNGRHVGYNTDCDGFLRTVRAMNIDFTGKILLIGCGGVGRMMAIEAARHGADITMAIIPEAQDMADCLKMEIGEKYPRISVKIVMMNEISGKFDLLVNATPVGMYPKSDACPVSEEVIGNCGAVFDAIYNPTKTKLVTVAESKGITAIGGMSMLVLQAVVAHEIWNGDSYTKEQIDKIINESVEIVNRDFK